MTVWFDGDIEIASTAREVGQAFANPGDLYVSIVKLMPGLTSVELVDQGSDWLTIRTNEGLMKRTGLSTHTTDDSVIVEFDEEYQAGSRVTVTSHSRSEFTTSEAGLSHHLAISNVEAPGVLGFLYRRFGGSKMGNAILASHKQYFEAP